MNASLSLVRPSARSFPVANAVVPGQTDSASKRFRLPPFPGRMPAENPACRPHPGQRGMKGEKNNTQPTSADTVVVLDFETTGLSPDLGERPIEVGAVLVEAGRIIDRFQSLMNPGKRINSFIEGYTGISNAMVRKAPPCAEVMAEFAQFIQTHNLVAHNASFDQKFLDAEFGRINCQRQGDFACSMLISRRIYPDAPNHKLGTLVGYKRLKSDGIFHRALADAEMAAHLWVALLGDIENRYRISSIPFPVMRKLARTPKASIDPWLWQYSRSHPAQGMK